MACKWKERLGNTACKSYTRCRSNAMSNELENTNFPFCSTRPFERLERSSESRANSRIGPLYVRPCVELTFFRWRCYSIPGGLQTGLYSHRSKNEIVISLHRHEKGLKLWGCYKKFLRNFIMFSKKCPPYCIHCFVFGKLDFRFVISNPRNVWSKNLIELEHDLHISGRWPVFFWFLNHCAPQWFSRWLFGWAPDWFGWFDWRSRVSIQLL